MTALSATISLKVEGENDFESLEGGKIILTWHGRTATAGPKFRNRGWGVMISNSRDGDMQKHIYEHLGYKVIRGSSGRGGERALIESIRFLRGGGTMAITPDGPRGPAGKVQEGVLMMARKSGASLVPWGVSATPRWLFGSWDRFMVPWPFAKAVILMGVPIKVPANASPEEIEKIRQNVEFQMHEIQSLAEKKAGEKPYAIPEATGSSENK